MTRASLCLLLLAGCDGAILVGQAPDPASEPSPVAGPSPSAPGTEWTTHAAPPLPSAATCTSAPSGRGYRGLGGESLEAGRDDVAAFIDTHRPLRNKKDPNSPYWSVITEIARVLGTTSMGDPELTNAGVGAAFGVVPNGWYEESEVGAFAVYVTFQYAAKACERASNTTTPSLRNGWFEHTTAAPTTERAQAFCTRTMRAAWLRAPGPDELAPCVELALALDEPDLKKRWALVCASVFTSPGFLAN